MFILDDLGEGNYWLAVGDSWNHTGSHNLSKECNLLELGIQGYPKKALECVMETAGSGTSMQASWYTDAPIISDWTGYRYVAFDVYNPENFSYELSWAIQTEAFSKWMETPGILVPSGVHTVLFDLFTLRNEGIQLSYAELEKALSSVDRAIFQSVNENPGGKLYASNFRLYKAR